MLGSSKWENLKVEHGESIRSAGIQGRGHELNQVRVGRPQRGSEIWTNTEGEQRSYSLRQYKGRMGESFLIVETPLNERERWGEGKRGRACTLECI